MANIPVEVRDFAFRALLFDAECARFRAAGLRVGIASEDAERDLLRESLSPFALALRTPALRMARLYATFFAFENSVREFIIARMLDKVGADWWDKRVPPKIKTHAETRKAGAEKNSWLEGESASLLHYVDFGHLCDIIINNWDLFSYIIPNQHWLKQRFDELEKVRNFLAHNRMLLDNEFDRIEMYIADWSKQVGF